MFFFYCFTIGGGSGDDAQITLLGGRYLHSRNGFTFACPTNNELTPLGRFSNAN